MKHSYDIACLMNRVIYFIGVVATLLAALNNHSLPKGICILFALYYALNILKQSIQNKNMIRDKYLGEKYVYNYMILSVFITLAFRSQHMLFVVLYVSGVSCFMFMQPKVSRLQIRATLVMLLVGFFIHVPGTMPKYSVFEYLVCAAAVLAILWMELVMVDYMAFQNRENLEQERSLDDFLKIIEVKCDEARQATRSKSDFLSNMSHEIRTPINAVLGMNEMILRECQDKAILKYAVNIESAGKMLLSLINDVLDFSKIESGRMEIIPIEYQVSSVLNDLVNMIKPRVEKKKLSLVLDINPDIPNRLFGDEVRIRQIVTNILTNAVKYTDSGTITLIADYQKDEDDTMQLYFAVKDTGRGIKDVDTTKLFESFQRVDEKKNRSIEGTGLGLSITKCFVDMMNGTIGVESEYGKGSVFYVYLPQKIMDKEPIGDFKKQFEDSVAEREHYHESFIAPKARILVVDDNEMNLEVVEGLLKQTKVMIDKVAGGRECLGILQRQKYDLILLDHMMPDMDGVETLEQMKIQKLAEGVPVIALTANAVSGAREMYLEYGFQEYLAKPIVGSALEKTLYRWLPKDLITVASDVTETKEQKIEKQKMADIQKERVTKSEAAATDDNAVVWPAEMNVKAALAYSFKGEQGILFNVSMYLKGVEKTRTSLVNCFEAENFKDYVIHAHSLKSTSATIGITELSELAKKLEFAGKQEDFDTIRENHQTLLDMYDEVVEHLKLLPKPKL